MSEVQVGDKVLAMGPDGKPFFDEVYLVPHKDSQAVTQYLTLTSDITSTTTVGTRAGDTGAPALTLSPQHYVEVLCAADDNASRCLRHASEVVPGDKVWLQSDEGEMRLATISKVSHYWTDGSVHT
jgi:hypothetical protein